MIYDLKPYPAYKDSGVLLRNVAANSFIEQGTKGLFFEGKKGKR